MAQNQSQLNEELLSMNLNSNLQDKLNHIMMKGNISKEDIKPLMGDISLANTSTIIRTIVHLFKSNVMWDKMSIYSEILNTIEDLVTSSQSNKNDETIYKQSIGVVFDEVFNDYCKFLKTKMKTNFDEADCNNISVLINIPVLLNIKTYEPLLFSLVKFLDRFCKEFNTITQFQNILINLVMYSNLYLVNFLAVHQNNLNRPGLKETINVYNTLKDNLINRIYTNSEDISSVLTILEQRSRYFGMTADAIPENENHGDYIIVDSMNAPLEDDEVYEDYEKFLATLPNN